MAVILISVTSGIECDALGASKVVVGTNKMSLAECLDTLCQAVFFHPAKMVKVRSRPVLKITSAFFK